MIVRSVGLQSNHDHDIMTSGFCVFVRKARSGASRPTPDVVVRSSVPPFFVRRGQAPWQQPNHVPTQSLNSVDKFEKLASIWRRQRTTARVCVVRRAVAVGRALAFPFCCCIYDRCAAPRPPAARAPRAAFAQAPQQPQKFAARPPGAFESTEKQHHLQPGLN